MQDGEFDLGGLQLGGDDEWAALEHGQRRATDQGDGLVGSCKYVCTFIRGCLKSPANSKFTECGIGFIPAGLDQ